mmetsp:Transcript_31971/g.78443  ORF Transcript_31971/g.78443 Transcript_31971/m.78443 type:complete len:90 (-) Transcript_31971:321-590(-)
MLDGKCVKECQDACDDCLLKEREQCHEQRRQESSMKTMGDLGVPSALCIALWDATALLGNPFALPGIADNIICGGLAAAGVIGRGVLDD